MAWRRTSSSPPVFRSTGGRGAQNPMGSTPNCCCARCWPGLRGEPRVCSMVPIPDEADEDERRRVREREDLVAERVSLVNRIGAVLATLGVR